jgi:hypothetical protein
MGIVVAGLTYTHYIYGGITLDDRTYVLFTKGVGSEVLPT